MEGGETAEETRLGPALWPVVKARESSGGTVWEVVESTYFVLPSGSQHMAFGFSAAVRYKCHWLHGCEMDELDVPESLKRRG